MAYKIDFVAGAGITSLTPSSSITFTQITFPYDLKRKLQATAKTGYSFHKWSMTARGDAGGIGFHPSDTTNPTTLFNSSSLSGGSATYTVTALATPNSYKLTTAKGTGIASVTAGANLYTDSKKQLVATASTGYTFKNWTSNNGGSFSNANAATTTYTMAGGNATVTANATLNSYTLTLSKGTGIASVSGGGSKGYNTKNQISATASTGYTFKNWTTSSGGTLSNANAATTTYTMPNNAATITANATLNSYTLTTAVSPNGGGTATAGGTMGYNTSKQLTATANTGYQFTSWSATSGTLSDATANPATYTIAAANSTVTANFSKINYNVTVEDSPAGSGTVSVSPSTAQMGDTVTISQTPAAGYEFTGYTTDPEVTIENDQFTMPASNVSITANYQLSFVPSTGTLDKSSYTGGETAELQINASSPLLSHKYKLRFKDGMETEFVDVAVGTSNVNIYIPVEWAMHIGSGTTISNGVLTLETYSDNILIGSTVIEGLSYTVLDNTIPSLKVWRCDANGNKSANGLYGKYAIVIPSSADSYSLSYGEAISQNPALTGDIIPGDKQEFAIGSNHMIRLTITVDSETFYFERDIPKIVVIRKAIN